MVIPIRHFSFMSNTSLNFARNSNITNIKDCKENTFIPKITIFSKESDTRLLLKTILEMWDFVVAEADCVKQLSAIFETKESNLIIFDFSFPFDEYLKTIRQIRKELHLTDVPIIGISGFAQSRYRNLAIAFGANEYLVKPIDFDHLKSYLNNYLRNNFNIDREEVNTRDSLTGGKK